MKHIQKIIAVLMFAAVVAFVLSGNKVRNDSTSPKTVVEHSSSKTNSIVVTGHVRPTFNPSVK